MNYLFVETPKCGSFRLLPKLHKDKFGIREIINCTNTPISNICLFIFLTLHPFIAKTETYLQDSQHLLQLINDIDCSKFENLTLFSGDFDSLYNNIEKEFAIDLILSFVNDVKALDNKHCDIFAFKELLTIVFTCNIFSFKNNFYVQNRGLAMGVSCGPTLANIVVYMMEKNWVSIHKPLIYRRFIDDIVMIVNDSIDIDKFKSNFGKLKLNLVFGHEIQFLDLKIIFDRVFRHIRTSL
jgi:hypothetical protein